MSCVADDVVVFVVFRLHLYCFVCCIMLICAEWFVRAFVDGCVVIFMIVALFMH